MAKYQIVCSIVIYNNSIAQLNKAIWSFLNSTLFSKLLIIDNSPDARIEGQLPAKSKLEYIFNGSNIGFGSAHNIGIKKYLNDTEYYLVLNPDVSFETGVLEQIYNFMNENKSIGLVMPKVLFPNGAIQYLPKLLPHPLDLLLRRFKILQFFFSKRFQRYELKEFSDSRTFDAPIISGCFSWFRVEALQMTGNYDERFFMYFEDFDLSRRINKNFRTVYYSDVQILHDYERGAEENFILFKIFVKSAIKYFNKWGWFFDFERNKTNKNTIQKLTTVV